MIWLRGKTSPTLLLIVPLLLSSLALTFSVPVVNAASTMVSVNPERSVADIGSAFSVSVDITDIQDLKAYDVTLTFDETQLEYVSSALSDTWTGFLVRKLPGSIRVAAGILFGSISVDPSVSSILVTHTFRLDLAGSSVLHISDSEVAVLGVGAVPHSTSDGTIRSSDKALVKINVVRAAQPTVDLRKGETSMDLQANIANNGPMAVSAFVAWRMVSMSGIVLGFNSPVVMVAPGTGFKTLTNFQVEAAPDTFSGSAALLVSEDGVNYSVVDVRQLLDTFSVVA